jgi:nucleoid DNA-binding protein
MNKKELVTTVADKAGLENKAAEAALDAVFDAISNALVAGDKVAIPGFGTFEVRDRSARTGRNPQTGETIDIAASKAPAFKPASALKNSVNS